MGNRKPVCRSISALWGASKSRRRSISSTRPCVDEVEGDNARALARRSPALCRPSRAANTRPEKTLVALYSSEQASVTQLLTSCQFYCGEIAVGTEREDLRRDGGVARGPSSNPKSSRYLAGRCTSTILAVRVEARRLSSSPNAMEEPEPFARDDWPGPPVPMVHTTDHLGPVFGHSP